MTNALVFPTRQAGVGCDTLTQRPLHVVQGVLSLDLGGLERLVVDLVCAGRKRGQRTSVVCIERPGKLAEQVESLGARLHCLAKPRGRQPTAIDRAEEILADIQPDIIHTHQVGALWYLGQAAQRLGGIPVVHTEHSDHVAHSRGWLEKIRARLLWRQNTPLAQRFCCVSEDIARSARRFWTVASAKVDVVPNGIDLEPYAMPHSACEVRASLGIPPGALVIGTVGRLVEVKRQDLLIRAFAALRRDEAQPGTWLLIVGDGPERRRLEDLAKKLGVAGRIVFSGYQPDPPRLLRAMDVFVLTSRHEGLPLALLEAWAAGLAVVASAVGAIPQTVIHGVSGMLFESGDLKGLVKTLSLLLEAPWVVSQLGRRGQMRVQQRYSLDRMAAEYDRRYRQLIHS